MENKKSFILYTDLKNTVDKLPDEYKGKLFQMILDYVNDKNPATDDLLLQIAFEPIKLQLKRDLKKYNSYIDKQRQNGKKGGRPKKTVNLKTEKTQPFLEKPKKADTVTVTVNDTVTDNVNVTVNDNDIKKENKNKKEVLLFPFETKSFKEWWRIWK